MSHQKMTAFAALTLIILGAFILPATGTVLARPPAQMTPGMDPMSQPTVVLTPMPGSGTMDPNLMTGQMTCPMMGGSMAGLDPATMQTAMPGMSGTTGMPGMGGMAGMGMMGQMGGMSQMGGMPMAGGQVMNDVLSMNARGGWFFNLNPWWLVGWFVLLVLVLALVGLGVLFLVRVIRKERQSPAS